MTVWQADNDLDFRIVRATGHIASIYGLEETGGRHFLVMELVPGETLADRIRRAPFQKPE